MTEAVRAESAVELAAVESAELGDLTGRAQQAVLLSREGASPVQVAAADRLLEEDPFGPAELFSAIDPTAAAVAAAHWLYAAAEAVSDVSGYAATDVVREADNIEATPHRTPSLVLELLDDGVSPYDAVTGLVRHAMRVADGVLPARDLLEDLLTGIHGCWLLHDEYAELDDENEDPNDEEESEDETTERHPHHSRAQFAALVRTIAAHNRDRLT